jgi:hypothetical protein
MPKPSSKAPTSWKTPAAEPAPPRSADDRPVACYHFGMRSVRLIINDPDSAHSSTSGCNCHGPSCQTPSHKALPARCSHTATASTPTSTTLVGIGVPSKWVTLPLSSSAIDSALTL